MRFRLRNSNVHPDVLARCEREKASELGLEPRAALACCPQNHFCPQQNDKMAYLQG